MGITHICNDSEYLLIEKVNDLIVTLEWYKEYIKNDFALPALPADKEVFMSRNSDIVNNIGNLTHEIKKFEECVAAKDYSFNAKEIEIRALRAAVILRYMRII